MQIIFILLLLFAATDVSAEQPPGLPGVEWSDPYFEWNQGDNYAIEEFVDLILPVSGREKRVSFLPLSLWGKKKPTYHDLKWLRFDSQHFSFYSYPEAEASLNRAIELFERHYDANNERFGVQGRFDRKIPIIIYQSREDFEQTHTIGGIIPEGLGGVTEPFSWKRVVFPFEGDLSKFEHVALHEGTHVYQIAAEAENLPLWFIEGDAETNSIFWDANAETIMRDGFAHGLIPDLDDLWQIQGTWLMYKTGNFITNQILQKYGKTTMQKIYANAERVSFGNNIQSSLGISFEKFSQEIKLALHQHFSEKISRRDFGDLADEITQGYLLTSHAGNFLTGKLNDKGRLELILNHYERRDKLSRQSVIVDRKLGVESLRQFQGGADMNDHQLIYPIKIAREDALMLQNYHYRKNEKRFALDKPKSFSFPGIEHITDPTLIDDSRFAFIGYRSGFANLYLYDRSSHQLKQLTKDNRHLSGLDYSGVSRCLVFARETEKTGLPADYNYELFLLALDSLKETQITRTDYDERWPRFSPDGERLLFSIDQDNELNLATYTLKTSEVRRITSAKIGFPRAEWFSNSEIYAITPRKFKPSVLLGELPARQSVIAAALPKGPGRQWVELPDFRSINPPSQPASSVQNITLGPMQIKERQLFLNHNGLHPITAITTTPQATVLLAKVATDQDPQLSYFKLGPAVAEPLLPLETPWLNQQLKLKEELKQFAKQNSIMEFFAAPNGNAAVLRVNNLLSLKPMHPGAGDSSLYFVQKSQATNPSQIRPQILKIENSQELSKLSLHLIKAQFLANQKILLVAQRPEIKSSRLRLAIYDIDKSQLSWPFDKALEYAIATTGNAVLVRHQNNQLRLYDCASGKTESIAYQGKLIETSAIGFTTSDSVVTITDLKKRTEKFRNYQLNFYQPQLKQWTTVPFALEHRHQVRAAVFSEVFATNRFTFALHCLDDQGEKNQESLFVFDPQEKKLIDISGDAQRFSQIFYSGALGGSTLFYTASSEAASRVEWRWYQNGEIGLFYNIAAAKLHEPSESLVVEGKAGVKIYSLKARRLETVATATFGFDFDAKDKSGEIIYSGLSKTQFALQAYSIRSGQTRELPTTAGDMIEPRVGMIPQVGKVIAFTRFLDDKFSVGRLQLQTKKFVFYSREFERLSSPEFKNQAIIAQLSAVSPNVTITPVLIEAKPPEVTKEARSYHNRFKLRRAAAAAAFDGEQFRYLVSAYADNLFSDQSLYLSSIFFTDELIASLGFKDHKSGWGALANYSDLEEIRVGSLLVSRSFLMDEFREWNVYGEWEIQDYQILTADSPAFITSNEAGNTFHVGKLGVAYGFDETLWDAHGPSTGKRFYARSEVGFNLETGEVANVDANLDLRLYQSLYKRLGLAHRVVAGISRGDLPTLFLLGGNISFRGVGFDDLVGNSYWVVSEELRLPLLDFIGFKLPDPIDDILGFFTRYFDVRGGMYGDVGAAWLENDPYETLYSIGYFFNVPTVFGVNFRFSQGIWGEEGIDIWLGYNW